MDRETTRRDVAAAYAPLSPDHAADPYPFYVRARRESPVFYSPAVDAWVVCRYEDAARVLKDHRRFATAILDGRSQQHTPEVRAILATTPILEKTMLNVDPPEHTRLRGSINRALSARRVAALEPRIRALCDGLIDGLEPRGGGDFMRLFAHPFPVLVIGSLLDLPEADFPRLDAWLDDLVDLMGGDLPADAQEPCARSVLALHRYVFDLADRRGREPGTDLAGELLTAVETGQAPLRTGEVAAMLQILIAAGFETTIRLLGSCVRSLLTDRRHWEAIVEDPTRIPAVVEEALRFDGPVVSTLRRATEDVDVSGTTIPSGALVMVVVSSANHDEAVFPDAETFHPDRVAPAGHLAFGQGVHFCVGALLARLETRVALEQLSRRLPSLRLAPGHRVGYRPNLLVRCLEQLHVEWDDRL
ncbi:MAG TPA: cytochrome P450 [Candidatus Dormibacteraeota bacterium]|nr:cytochrome P450 [Candidatus Dormibacteraeota bacterium]